MSYNVNLRIKFHIDIQYHLFKTIQIKVALINITFMLTYICTLS